MLISVNFSRIREHISILGEEKKAAQGLEYSLAAWYQQITPVDPSAEIIAKQLDTVRRQISYIDNRIAFLESAIEEFYKAKETSAALLTDAEGLLAHFNVQLS